MTSAEIVQNGALLFAILGLMVSIVAMLRDPRE